MPNYVVKQNKTDFIVKRDRKLEHNRDTTFIRNMYQGEYFVVARSKEDAVVKIKNHLYQKMQKKEEEQKKENKLIKKLINEGIHT